MLKKLKELFSSPRKIAVANALIITIAIIMNTLLQVFCRPTLWATVVLIICFGNTIYYPLINRSTGLVYLTSFINGISFCLFIYCAIFIEGFNLVGLFLALFVIGLIFFIPHFFIVQLFITNIIKQKSNIARGSFLAGIIVSVLIAIGFNFQYKNALKSIENFKQSNFQSLEKTFMTEKIFGMYFKYHTRICEYDGWRPPLHEPALVIGQWLNGREDPLGMDINTEDVKNRVALYKTFFPGEPVKLDCSCAIAHSESYHNELFLR